MIARMDDFDRRKALTLLLAAPWLAACKKEEAGGGGGAAQVPQAQTAAPPPKVSSGSGEVLAIVLYPKFTLLDAIGPHHIFASLMGARTLLVAKTRDPVATDTGVSIAPNATFADCPEELTALCVPGGTLGTLEAMEDPELQAFVRSRGEKAKWLTSVCTGALVLGAAGLLRGYKATTHWMVHELLAELGATPVKERVVRDRNRMTGGGVTAGIDMALTLAIELRGKPYAEMVQLLAEYAPAPPLDAGRPETAPASAVETLSNMMRGFTANAAETAKRAKAKWPG